MEDLPRLTKRLNLAKRCGEYHHGCYVVTTDITGTFYVCSMTGQLKRYVNLYGQNFPEPYPQHDVLCDDYLYRWDNATDVEILNPVITFFPDDKIDTLPPHLKDQLLKARSALKKITCKDIDVDT